MAAESQMPARDALALYALFERAGIKVWIDGGWAVDALLGKPTRGHSDLDIAVEARLLDQLRSALALEGYRPVPREDTRPWNFALGNDAGREIDVHAFTFDSHGDGVYGPPENGEYYRASALTGEGVIDNQPVRCIAAAWLVRFHTGYRPKAKDFQDVRALCARFGIDVPEEYQGAPPAA